MLAVPALTLAEDAKGYDARLEMYPSNVTL
jgi:hypothetical protein